MPLLTRLNEFENTNSYTFDTTKRQETQEQKTNNKRQTETNRRDNPRALVHSLHALVPILFHLSHLKPSSHLHRSVHCAVLYDSSFTALHPRVHFTSLQPSTIRSWPLMIDQQQVTASNNSLLDTPHYTSVPVCVRCVCCVHSFTLVFQQKTTPCKRQTTLHFVHRSFNLFIRSLLPSSSFVHSSFVRSFIRVRSFVRFRSFVRSFVGVRRERSTNVVAANSEQQTVNNEQ